MTDDVARLKSINWTTGMLLAPEHFRRQDAYFDETIGWLLRYCLPGTGLVGGGVRIAAGERGLAKFDPRVELHDDGTTLRLTVLEARGLTPLGELVDVSGSTAVRLETPKSHLAGASELAVFVVHTGEREEDPASIGRDPANPTQAAYRRTRYRVQLGIDADTAPHALCVGRIRRASETLSFEVDGRFIPACSTLLGHSSLYAASQRAHGEVVRLSGQYAELHRQGAHYADQVARRGADVRHDRDIIAFVERATLALDHCAYETADPTLSPEIFFREIERTGRRVALGLDLSESTRLYFAELGQADANYGTLLEEERELLTRPREVAKTVDLAVAVARAETTLLRLRRLVEALEARYIDYRVNRSIDALRFLLDGDGEQFFLSVATPGHPQRDLETLTFVFSQMSLAARRRYRLVFLADPDSSSWNPGDAFRVDIRVNPGQGSARPLSRELTCELPGQRNFATDFDPGEDIASLTSLQVTVQPGTRIRGCILYQRQLGMGVGGGAPVGGEMPAFSAAPAISVGPKPAASAPPPRPSPAPPASPSSPSVPVQSPASATTGESESPTTGQRKAIKVTIKPGPNSGQGNTK